MDEGGGGEPNQMSDCRFFERIYERDIHEGDKNDLTAKSVYFFYFLERFRTKICTVDDLIR